MARVFTEGFEFGDLGDFADSGSGIANTGARSGTYCLYGAASGAAGAKRVFSALSELYVRTGVKLSIFSSEQCISLYSGSNRIASISFTNANRIDAYIGGSSVTFAPPSSTLVTSTWYLVEIYFKMADASGRFVVKIDGITVIDYTGDTKPGSDTTVDTLLLVNNGNFMNVYYDDVALNDTTGGADNSWCGDGHVIRLAPNGNGDTNNWTGSDGNSTDNYLLVDEVPHNSDTDYVESSTAAQQDMYAMADWNGTSKSVLRVWSEARAKDTVAAGGQIKVGMKLGTTVYLSSAISLLTSYTKCKGTEYKTNPDTSSAWTDGDVDGAQFVVECE